MRGRHEEQEVMLAYVNLEERVPKDHPLRAIKAVADEAYDHNCGQGGRKQEGCYLEEMPHKAPRHFLTV